MALKIWKRRYRGWDALRRINMEKINTRLIRFTKTLKTSLCEFGFPRVSQSLLKMNLVKRDEQQQH